MEADRRYFELCTVNLDSERLNLLEVAFGANMLSRSQGDHIAVFSTPELVKEVAEKYEWIISYDPFIPSNRQQLDP